MLAGRIHFEKNSGDSKIDKADNPGPDSDDIGSHDHVLFDQHRLTIAILVATVIDPDQSALRLPRWITIEPMVRDHGPRDLM